MEHPIWFYGKFLALLGVVSLMVGFNFLTWGFHRTSTPHISPSAAARPERGAALIRNYGCNACHAIAGSNTRPQVGPSLERLPDQLYIAGKLTNTPENLARWIQSPAEIRPGTAMPNLYVGDDDARDIAAYLLLPAQSGRTAPQNTTEKPAR